MIAKVIQWANGIVMVFDENDEQMPDFQGPRNTVSKKLAGEDLSKATFEIGVWNGPIVPINKHQFFSEAWK